MQLKGINAQALNQNYNKNNILSMKDLHFQNGDETLDLAGEVKETKTHEETVNEVAGVGFAPTIRTLRMRVSSTRLRASPTTENSMAQENEYVNEKKDRVNEIDGKENKNGNKTKRRIKQYGAFNFR